jgi:hypothetical protein
LSAATEDFNALFDAASSLGESDDGVITYGNSFVMNIVYGGNDNNDHDKHAHAFYSR